MGLYKKTPPVVLLMALLACQYSHAQVAPLPAPYGTGIKVNYVREWSATAPEQNPAILITRPFTDVKQTTQYVDGLGRPLQTVIKQASPQGRDMVIPVVYDSFGREVYKYLPFISNTAQTGDAANDGNIKLDPYQQQALFSQGQYPGQTYFYGQINFEASPLGRPLNAYPAGDSWVGASRGTATQYLSNSLGDSVQIWNISVTAGSLPVSAGIYPAGKLYKTVITDEQNHSVVEYKDIDEHIVLKKVQLSANPGTAHAGWLCTYNVYDNLNNLRFVLQPRAVELINTTANHWTITQPIADELCFRYEYDQRNRMIIKKDPGSGEVWMIYDSRDRLALSQNAFLRQTHQWQFIKYDAQNRQVMTGLYTDNTNTSQSAMQAYLTTQNLGLYETYSPAATPLYTLTNSFPAVTDETTVRSYTFYDDYSFGNWYGSNFASKDNSYDSQFPAASSTYPYPQPLTQNKQTRGMETGRIDKKINNNSGLISARYYDDKARVIQEAVYNFSQGIDITTTQYSFSSQPLQTILRHQKNGANPQTHTVTTTISYDPAGRLSAITKAITSVINGQTVNKPAQVIVANQYNEMGQLQKRSLGSLDSLVYDYNIRGWLTGLNKNYVGGSANNYFGMELAYDKLVSITGTGYPNVQYNGNIAGTIWKSAGDGMNRKYDFTYDNVNRLLQADFNQANGAGFDKSAKIDFSVSGLNYDANGNILSMKQVGFKVGGSGTIDSLAYSYQNAGMSNKLQAVTDGANDQNSKMGDFHYNPATKGSTDYTYDSNGSLVTDNNKGITFITYNYLDLPQSIYIKGKGTISYIYDNAGTKLAKTTVDSTSVPVKTTTTVYIGNFVYQNDTLQFMGEEEGRVRWAFHQYLNGTTGYGFERDFFEKDHLGNTRVVLTQQKDTAQYVATMEAAYRAKENALYYNIPASSVARTSAPGYPVDISVTNPNDSVARLNGSGIKVGPAIILKVMSGDKVDLGTNFYYNASSTSNGQTLSPSDVLTSLATGIVSLTGGAHGSLTDLTGPSSPLTGPLNSFLTTRNGTVSGKPNAYLNWILLDDQFNYVSTYPQSGALQVGAAGATAQGGLQSPLGYAGIPITKSGYLYIYVSNATPGWDVFFDNPSVKTYSGPLLEETHYYPYGLTMAGISDKALKTQYAENKYKFNDGTELASKEFSNGTGLELYETYFRGYDPQLGRFWQTDPLGSIFEDWSPYSFAFDDPVNFNDPLGLAPENGPNKKKHKPKPKVQTLEPVTVVGYKKNCRTCSSPAVHADPPPDKPSPINYIYWPNPSMEDRQEYKRDQGLYFDRVNAKQPLIQGGESQHYLHSLAMYQTWTQSEHEGRIMQVTYITMILGPAFGIEMAAAGGDLAELYDLTYFWSEQGYNVAVRDLIYAIRYGLASRLTVDQIIKLEKMAEKYRDLNKVITPKNIHKVFDKINDMLKH